MLPLAACIHACLLSLGFSRLPAACPDLAINHCQCSLDSIRLPTCSMGRRVDQVNLLPGSTHSLDFSTENSGTW